MKKREAVIFDIDGTLADVSHRRRFLPDWGKFFSAMDKDPLNKVVADIMQAYIEHDDIDVIVCTARPKDYLEKTVIWLRQHGIAGYDHLFMRPKGDFRSDTTIKEEMLEKILDLNYEILFVVDDRQGVVDMWREKGLVCLQCAPGDFDKQALPQAQGLEGKELLHVLVGPSGAGKNYILHMLSQENEGIEISSDDLREQICGDFKDQSQNDVVFYTAHEMTRIHLNAGLPVWFNATNVRTRDRKRLLDLAPRSIGIVYHVINRPMSEKVRDGGYRNDVRVGKNQLPLMEYHENIFRSNLKDILNGDGDPRVRVEDHRE